MKAIVHCQIGFDYIDFEDAVKSGVLPISILVFPINGKPLIKRSFVALRAGYAAGQLKGPLMPDTVETSPDFVSALNQAVLDAAIVVYNEATGETIKREEVLVFGAPQ